MAVRLLVSRTGGIDARRTLEIIMSASLTTRYDRVSIVLHWVIGLGIVLLAGTELFRQEFPKGHFIRDGLKPVHMPLGTILFALILARLAWRLFAARVPSDHSTGRNALAAKAIHLALYGLMVGAPLLGLVYTFGSGKVVDFGAFQLALPLKDLLGGVAKGARGAHEVMGISILVLAGLHAVAALGHHYLLRDDVLARMLPARRAASHAVPAE